MRFADDIVSTKKGLEINKTRAEILSNGNSVHGEAIKLEEEIILYTYSTKKRTGERKLRI